MCGITGIYLKTKINNIEQRVEKMTASIAHRGPDAGGVVKCSDRVCVGHRRLSIIDISNAANQPMISNSGKWTLVFNGEIYNYKELKSSLNYDFISNSDTEVILAAVEIKGIDWFLQKANGMFAIALFNNESNEMLLIRDRMGIKPLYYYINEEELIFASEIKGILNSGLIQPAFNESAIDEYLGNRYVREPFTFFENIFQVNSGCYLSVDVEMNYTTKRYWQLPEEFNMEKSYNEKDILVKFNSELNNSIQKRMISDVPLGTYLSGGVDSSIITAIAAEHSSEKLNTYTIGYPELNEFEYAKIVSDMHDTNHHEIITHKENYLDDWNNLISYKDAPLGVPNEIPLAQMSTELKKEITVVLSGEGADELLGGYGRIFRSAEDFNKTKDSNLNFYEYFIHQYEYVPREIRDRVLNTDLSYRSYFDKQVKSEFENIKNEENIFRFFHNYHVKGLLQRVDITTMQTSVEARVPFLDHELIEFSYKEIPYDMKLRWKDEESKKIAQTQKAKEYSEVLDIPKYALRQISYDYIPKSVIERKKVGFPVPLTKWFKDLEVLAKELLPQAEWLKEKQIDNLITEIKANNISGQILWMFINIELFKKQYFEKKWVW